MGVALTRGLAVGGGLRGPEPGAKPAWVNRGLTVGPSQHIRETFGFARAPVGTCSPRTEPLARGLDVTGSGCVIYRGPVAPLRIPRLRRNRILATQAAGFPDFSGDVPLGNLKME